MEVLKAIRPQYFASVYCSVCREELRFLSSTRDIKEVCEKCKKETSDE